MYLQAAVDTSTIEQAEQVLSNLAPAPEISVIEIGTPLITHYGVECARVFSKHVGTNKLYADLKVIDFPTLEIMPYRELGITRFSVMAFMHDQAFRELAAFSREQNTEVFVSTMGYPLPLMPTRIAELAQFGFSQVICHGAGSLEGDAFFDMTARAQRLADIPNIKLIGAGGIRTSNAHLLKQLKLSGLIVGRGLTGVPNISQTAAEILRNVQ